MSAQAATAMPLASVAMLAVQAAALEPGQRVLVTASMPDILVAAVNHDAAGVEVVTIGADALALVPGDVRPFDRVLVDTTSGPAAGEIHVVHTFELLRPGGRLVALLPGTRSEAFIGWCAAHSADPVPLDDATATWLLIVERAADAPVFMKAAALAALQARCAELATERAVLETDLIYLDEDDLPMAKAAGAVTRTATLVHARAEMIGELLAVEDGLAALERQLRHAVVAPPAPFAKARRRGPGSRGGQVIGYTRSGKAIYARFHHEAHAPFSRGEHLDAAERHRQAIIALERGGLSRDEIASASRLHEIQRGHHVRAAARSSELTTGVVDGAHERVVGSPARPVRIPEAWRALSDDRLHAAARTELRRLVETKATAPHPELETIHFTKETVGESLYKEHKSREELLLVGDLRKLLPHAQRVATEKPREANEARTGIRAYHQLELMVRVGPSKPFLMRFTVRENRDGQCFYVFRRARDTRPVTKSAGSVAYSPGAGAPLGLRVAPPEAGQTRSRFTEPAPDESVLEAILVLKSRRLHGRRWLDGLHVSIENRRGSVRHWYDPFAERQGKTTMVHPYGYVRRTIGIDGDQVDVFLGPLATGPMTEAKKAALRASTVYIVHTRKPPDFRELDEQKCFLGFGSADEVRIAFATHYDNPGFFGQMDALPWDEFKACVRATAEGHTMIRGTVVGRAPLTMAKAAGTPPNRMTPAPLSLRGPATAGKPTGPAQPPRLAPADPDAAGAKRTKPGATPEQLAGHLAAAWPALQKALEQATKGFAGADVAARLRETIGAHARDTDDDGVPSTGDDVGSVRITVASIAEQQRAVDRVRRVFKVQREDDFLTKPTSGYRAYHFVVTVDGQPVELQLRTARQTRWADYAHDAAYAVHGQQAQPELRQYLLAMGAFLAKLDGEGGGGDAGQPPECPEAIAQQLGELDAS